MGGVLTLHSSLRRCGVTPKSETESNDRVKKKVRSLLKNGFSVAGRKTIKGHDYLYFHKGKIFKSAGPYAVAEPYLRSLTSPKRTVQAPVAPGGAEEIAAEYKREFDQLEADAVVNPARLKDYIRSFVPRRDVQLWRRFSLLAGVDGPDVLNPHLVNRSYHEKIRMAVANGDKTPEFYPHVVEKMNEWIGSAIESKRGRLAAAGAVSSTCARCQSTLEVHPDLKTNLETYRVWCSSCREYKTWNCGICDATLSCYKDDKLAFGLGCPRCGYGYRFAQPIKLNSPQTQEGWRLLRLILQKSPAAFYRKPDKILGEVIHYETEQEAFWEDPEFLALNLREAGVPPFTADSIASIACHKHVKTTD